MLELTTKEQLIGFFNGWKSPVRAKLVTRTPVKLKKTGNPFPEVFKVQTIEVDLNQSYEDKVNDQRMLEGDMNRDFEAGKRAWGTPVNQAIIEKDGGFYLNAIEVGKIGTPVYEDAAGKPIEYAQIEPFVPSYSAPAKQGLENPVKVRTFNLKNVIGLNIDNKVRYIAK